MRVDAQGTDLPQREVVLIFFAYFPSEYSVGPAISVRRLAKHLSRYVNVRIVTLNYDLTTRRPLFPEPHRVLQEGDYLVEYIPYDFQRYRYLLRHLRNPETVVGVNCGFDYRIAIPTLMMDRLLGSPKRIVHFPHGIFLPVLMGQKQFKKILFCRAFDLIGLGRNMLHVASSEDEARDVQELFRTTQDIVVLPHFGEEPVDDGVDAPAPKRPGELRLCFAGRVAAQKNLLGAFDILGRLNVPCEFDIIGPVGDEAYYRACQDKMRALPGNVTVRFLGAIPHDELKTRLSAYHVFFSPTFGENFGQAILEGLACGVPALISERTPWNDLEAHGAGWAVPLAAPDRFVEILQHVYHMGADFARAPAIAYAAAKANPPGLDEALLDAFGLSKDKFIGQTRPAGGHGQIRLSQENAR